MVFSYLIYIGLLLFCGVVASVGDRRDERRCVWLIIAALTLVAGLRAASVGIDTPSYLEKFEYIVKNRMDCVYGLETSFKLLSYVVLKLIPHPNAMLLLMALITNGCMVARMWELRRAADFKIMILSYYMAYFFMSMNVMRQFCAIGILFYGTRYVVKRQYLSYALYVIMAACIHRSALIGLVFPVNYVLRKNKKRINWKWIVAVSAVSMPILFVLVWPHVSRYLHYVNLDVNIGLMVPAKLGFILSSLYIVLRVYGEEHYFPDWWKMRAEEKESIYLACRCYVFGLCVLFASYFIPTLNRVGWYFTIHEGIVMGMLVKTNRKVLRYGFSACAFLLLGYAFIHSMTRNGQGIMPYLFVWQ